MTLSSNEEMILSSQHNEKMTSSSNEEVTLLSQLNEEMRLSSNDEMTLTCNEERTLSYVMLNHLSSLKVFLGWHKIIFCVS